MAFHNILSNMSYQFYDSEISSHDISYDKPSPQLSQTSENMSMFPLVSNDMENPKPTSPKPKLNSTSNDKSSLTRGPWTKDEDSILYNMVSKLGPERWVVIAKELGSRNGKQCRERWHNHLDPSIIKTPFTPEEDAKIWHLFHTLGPRWALMAKDMPGRPDNSIKNHFNTVLRPRRIFKKREAESLAAAQNSESPVVLTPSTEHTPDTDKAENNVFDSQIVNEQVAGTKRKNTTRAPKKSYKKICKKPSEESNSPHEVSQWPVSNGYSFHQHPLDNSQSAYHHMSSYPAPLTNNYPPSFLPSNLCHPFNLPYQNIQPSIPKVLTMDDPDWDFLQQLGNQLGLPLNLN